MIPESLCYRVYFSALLPEVCPVTYKGLADALDRYGVPFSLLKGTKDIWCRDYMPLHFSYCSVIVLWLDYAAKFISVSGRRRT